MSCHTWVYKKASALTDAEKERIIGENINSIKSFHRDKSFEEYKERMMPFYEDEIKSMREYIQHYGEDNPESIKLTKLLAKYTSYLDPKKLLKKYEEKIRKEKKDIDNLTNGTLEERFNAVFKIMQMSKVNVVSAKKFHGETYVEIDFDQPFRFYKYTNKTFIDKENLLAFLSKNMQHVGVYIDNQYISGYTPELVKSINDYFEKHGENNLLFEFG